MAGDHKCSVVGCDRPHRSGGFCSMHFREAQARGEARDLRRTENRTPAASVTCRVEGCDSEAKYRGHALCTKHYLRRRKHGSFDLPESAIAEKLAQRSVQQGECLIWTGSVANSGYGRLGSGYAHRIAYEERHGAIPDGLQIDHLCRNVLCINPDHLEAVTQAENLRRQGDHMKRDPETGRLAARKDEA